MNKIAARRGHILLLEMFSIRRFGPDLRLPFKLHEIWPVDYHEKSLKLLLSDFKAMIHQNRFRLGLRP